MGRRVEIHVIFDSEFDRFPRQYLRREVFPDSLGAAPYKEHRERAGPRLYRYHPSLWGVLLAQTIAICSFRMCELPFRPDTYEVRLLSALYFRRPGVRSVVESNRFSWAAWMLRNLYRLYDMSHRRVGFAAQRLQTGPPLRAAR